MAYNIAAISSAFNKYLITEGAPLFGELRGPIYTALTNSVNRLNTPGVEAKGEVVFTQLCDAISDAEIHGTPGMTHETALKVAKAACYTVHREDGFGLDIELPEPPANEEKEPAASELLNDALRAVIAEGGDEDEEHGENGGGIGGGGAGIGGGGDAGGDGGVDVGEHGGGEEGDGE